jgi:hypothetical protein
VAEQSWNLGGRLYLSSADPIIELDPAQMGGRAQVSAALARPNVAWVALQAQDVERWHYESMLEAAGFSEEQTPIPTARSGYRLFRRRVSR